LQHRCAHSNVRLHRIKKARDFSELPIAVCETRCDAEREFARRAF
jgi:hypothetical protein